MNYVKDIRDCIVEWFLFGDGNQLEESSSFLEEGIIDSTGILELVTFIEEKYNVKIEDDELLPENLDSLKNVSAFLHNKIT